MNSHKTKPLLCFAYKGEAKSFMRYFSAKKTTDYRDLFEADLCYILLTKEGIENTLFSLTTTLTILKDKVSKVVNLGIAGSLDEGYKLLSCYDIDTAHRFAQQSREYKSYTTKSNHTQHDLISTNYRVLQTRQADKLKPFAAIVDCEAWAVGMVCNRLNIPFYATKCISDYIYANSTSSFDIVQQAELYSEALLQHYLQNY